MRKLISVLLLLMPACLSAQIETEDVIYLRNGAVYRGTITDRRPGASYTIRIFGGDSMRVAGTEVDTITTEPRVIHETLNRTRRKTMVNMEIAMSYIACFKNAFPGDGPAGASHGGGFSLLPEIHRRHGAFSFLIGAAVQVLSVRDFETGRYWQDYILIPRGYQVRYQVPVWFRWTFGRKTRAFFQFGWNVGGYLYQGEGIRQDPYSYGYYPPRVDRGRQRASGVSFAILPMGVGIRRHIAPQVELISYLEGAPLNFEVVNNDFYRPYLQLHVGVNFGTGKRK